MLPPLKLAYIFGILFIQNSVIETCLSVPLSKPVLYALWEMPEKSTIQTILWIRESHNRRKSCKILFSGIINITKFRIFITLMCLVLEDSNIELNFWFPQRWNFTLPKLVVEKDGEKSRKRSSSDGSEKMERTGDRKKKLWALFDRPKPSACCSTNGRRSKLVVYFRRCGTIYRSHFRVSSSPRRILLPWLHTKASF
jgi:hypothetical protein